jgi:hypothetical protein
MATPVIGAGYLRVIDRLQDVSYSLFEPVVNLQFPVPIGSGPQIIGVGDPSIYVGCLLVAGITGVNLEVITVTAFTPTSFSAVFANAHATGEWINGATFPVRYPTDPLFTQAEMISYISSATNDFYTDVPLAYNLADLTVGPTAQNTALPSDSLFPVRIAYNSYPLRETSQSNLDSMFYNWTQAALDQPRNYFRDKIPLQNVGIWPRSGNTVNLECVYAQRQAQTMGWGDGFLVPDPLTVAIFQRTLSFAYSKDGEMRNPGLARYWSSRYQASVKIAKMILDVINDPEMQ